MSERRRIGRCLRGMDHKLGYCGRDRFVLFYYEPRGEEVVWRDSHSCGFSTGAWSVFMDEVVPLADRCKVDVGDHGTPGRHVLVIDRLAHKAYFVEKEEAMRLVVDVGEDQQEAIPRTNVPSVAMSQKTTPEATARQAHEVWEGEGGHMS